MQEKTCGNPHVHRIGGLLRGIASPFPALAIGDWNSTEGSDIYRAATTRFTDAWTTGGSPLWRWMSRNSQHRTRMARIGRIKTDQSPKIEENPRKSGQSAPSAFYSSVSLRLFPPPRLVEDVIGVDASPCRSNCLDFSAPVEKPRFICSSFLG